MTDPTYGPGGPVERPAAGGLAANLSPELVAGILAVVVVVALLGSRFAVTGGGGIATPTPTPSPTPSPVQSGSVVASESTIRTLLQVDATLAEMRKALADELKATVFDVGDAKATMIQINQQLPFGSQAAATLASTPEGSLIGPELLAVYSDAAAVSGPAVLVSPNLGAEKYKANAVSLVAILARLVPLDARLNVMLTGQADPAATGVPSVPATPQSPSPSVGPSAIPTSTPTSAPSTAPPTAPPPSPSASTLPPPTPSPSPGPNELLNPGFEDPTLAQWGLALTPPAVASDVADPVNPHSGKLSARIDISEPTTIPNWIVLRQTGLTIESGAVYQVQLWARSAATRTVRIRITSPTGNMLGDGVRVIGIGPEWTLLSFNMTSFAGSDNAIFAIEVGGDTATVWVDDASLARIPPGAP